MNPVCKMFEKVRHPLPCEEVVSSNRLKSLKERQMLPRKKKIMLPIMAQLLLTLRYRVAEKDQEYLKDTY